MINTLNYNREVMNDINKSFNDPKNKKQSLLEIPSKEEKAEYFPECDSLKEENQKLKSEIIRLQA